MITASITIRGRTRQRVLEQIEVALKHMQAGDEMGATAYGTYNIFGDEDTAPMLVPTSLLGAAHIYRLSADHSPAQGIVGLFSNAYWELTWDHGTVISAKSTAMSFEDMRNSLEGSGWVFTQVEASE